MMTLEPFDEKYRGYASLILDEAGTALRSIDPSQAEALVNDILNARKVFAVGVGRVMLSMQAFVKRLAHLGVDALCVGEITEPAIPPDDLLIAASGSGESIFPKGIAMKAKSLGARVIHIGSNAESGIKPYCDGMVRIPVRTKLALPDEIPSGQPMSSLFEQSLFLLGDIVALAIIDKHGLDMASLWEHHANLE
jgi:6-phospho-3-hexuloisomerase